MMDIRLFNDMLSIDSTSGMEGELADMLSVRLLTSGNTLERFNDNLLFSWGKPDVLFCTHMDTVPPYIPPTFESDDIVRGRGTCDAKGQIFAMWEACKALEAKGYEGFGLLLLTGEETGSFGAKSFRDQHP